MPSFTKNVLLACGAFAYFQCQRIRHPFGLVHCPSYMLLAALLCRLWSMLQLAIGAKHANISVMQMFTYSVDGAPFSAFLLLFAERSVCASTVPLQGIQFGMAFRPWLATIYFIVRHTTAEQRHNTPHTRQNGPSAFNVLISNKYKTKRIHNAFGHGQWALQAITITHVHNFIVCYFPDTFTNDGGRPGARRCIVL